MKAWYAKRRQAVFRTLFALSLLTLTRPSTASLPDDAQWIWSPAHPKAHVPQGDCYFRKIFTLNAPEQGRIEITCDDQYELYVNGHHVASADDWKTIESHDISTYLTSGQNVVAVKGTNLEPGTAGLAARIVVQQKGAAVVTYPTDGTWKTSIKESADWNNRDHVDAQWLAAQSFGRLAETRPWGGVVRMAGEQGRFRTRPEFSVEWVLAPETTGSLIALTFNEFGQIIASREGGPLLLMRDSDNDGVHETVETYCDQVKNCQGLLAVNGDTLAVGDGPTGAALYRLIDKDQDGRAETVETVLKFKGSMGEHGPHAVTLGPEGLIYMLVGNHGALEQAFSSSSPHQNYYEGDLVLPRYEDPGGHAVGIKAPGGVILRTDAHGSFVEAFAGGLRNPYDIAFNREGELFTCDADMEWDIGLPWYRPTRINHVTPGAELGWRSGWSKWPEYFIDSLPATLETGAGSPTGVAFYEHVMYPVRYQHAMFVCDWSRGRINVVRFEKQGGSYRAKAETFVEGKPLNVTDIEVGPDGWLYFCTGGRGTAGGIYRVVWNGNVPSELTRLGSGIQGALQHPQLQSAWARQRIARIQQQLGNDWDAQLVGIAKNSAYPAEQRARALDLLQVFGPAPNLALLLEVSKDADAGLRAKAVYLMGVQGDDGTATRLVELLEDQDPLVRRRACESLVRLGYEAPFATLTRLLADPDRFVAFAARRALEQLPPQDWQDGILRSRSMRVFLQGSTALLVAHPSPAIARAILDRCVKMIRGDVQEPGTPRGYISDRDFTDMLRVIQLALLRGNLKRDDVPLLRDVLAEEYPSRNALMNRELVRLLVYLEASRLLPRLVDQLAADIPLVEKLHVAIYAPHLEPGWTARDKLDLFKFFEQARQSTGGNSLQGYLDNASRTLAAQLTPSEQHQVLAHGAEWPHTALAVLIHVPRDPGKALLRELKELDRSLQGAEGEAAARLRIGIVAVLGRSGDPQAMTYLRELFQSDASRREVVAMGLAQAPSGENWQLLVQSLGILEGAAAGEVLTKLATVKRKPDSPEPIRQAILCGLRTQQRGAKEAVHLLEQWTGETVSEKQDEWDAALAKWQAWFLQKYPDHPEPRLPVDPAGSKWTFQELLTLLESPAATQGNPQRGAAVYQNAQCAKCHRFGSLGERVGPDLTTISQRFHKKEILESILFPSHIISDQYASKTVVTAEGRTFTGIVTKPGPDSVTLVDLRGDKIEIPAQDVEKIQPSRQSVMPEGLLDPLTPDEIADLFAYLNRPPTTVVTTRRQVRPAR